MRSGMTREWSETFDCAYHRTHAADAYEEVTADRHFVWRLFEKTGCLPQTGDRDHKVTPQGLQSLPSAAALDPGK
jgi:hypothetical protein